MNVKMDENQLNILKEYEFDKPLNHKIDSIIDKSNRDCQNKNFQTLEYKCIYNNKLTNIGNIEIVNLTSTDKSMNIYEFKRNLKIARQKILNLFK